MKKKIGLLLLMITLVAVGTAFAQVVRDIPFDASGSKVPGFTILKVQQGTNGIFVTYKCTTSPGKVRIVFSIIYEGVGGLLKQ